MLLQHFLLQKSDSHTSECEDAIQFDLELGRFAVADGATEGFDSGRWANILVEGWVKSNSVIRTIDEFQLWLNEQSQLLQKDWSTRTLPWYAEEKARSGSYAAFVGVDVNYKELMWRAVALGDTCLVHIRNSEIFKALPLSSLEQFNSSPILVSSLPSMQRETINHVVIDSGSIESGDELLLLSDAIAMWYLKMHRDNRELIAKFESLLSSSNRELLINFFEEERRLNRLKDDDIAIVRAILKPL
jgi:hypothetical protein